MEIIALYVEEYMAIEKQAFCFSSEYEFSFDEKRSEQIKSLPIPMVKKTIELTITKNENYINIFKPYFDSVTGIIGKNGSGKTTLTKLIRVLYSNKPIENTCLVVFKHEGTFYIDRYKGTKDTYQLPQIELKTVFENIDEKEKSNFKNIINESNPNNFLNLSQSSKIIYHSNILTNSINLESKNIINCSLDNKLRKLFSFDMINELVSEKTNLKSLDEDAAREIELSRKDFDLFRSYYNDQLKKFINFLVYLNNPENELLKNELQKIIKVPSKINLRLPNITENNNITSVLNFSDISKDVTRITNYYSAKEREPVISTEVLINRLKITYFIYLISESLDDTSMASDYDDMKKDIEQKDSIKQYLKTYKLRPGNTISEDLIEFLTTKNINGNRFVTYQKDFFSLLETINSSDIDGRYSILAPMTFVLNLSPNSINLLEKINDFNQKIDLNVLDYSWNHILSSGEEAMLNQYSEIYDEHPNFKASESICFVIDEGELYLHPEWQKTYLKALVIFLNYVCNAKASKQLILTSHSPFIVSDLPNSNLIFLDIKNGKTFVHNKFEVGNTFGGNILALFANSFFLSSFMGDYAKMMIDDVINYINGKPSKYIKDKSDAIKIIDLIGESIIKDQLIKMLDRMRIKDLETRVDHLEGK